MLNKTHPIVELQNISKTFTLGKQKLQALNSINIKIHPGETLGIIGESGCGKSTLGRVILQLERQSSGNVLFDGEDISRLTNKQLEPLRRKMQMIFQDPYASLNPRMIVEDIIGEGLDIHRLARGKDRLDRIKMLTKEVGLDIAMLGRYPHEFSGGQRQRIGIARALALDPELIVCDEPLSALDIRTQRHIIELLLKFKSKNKLAYLFISHDLHAVKTLADTVAVMYCGRIVEYGPAKQVLAVPQHPYTQALLSATPTFLWEESEQPPGIKAAGEPPSLLKLPSGCPFHPRCPKAVGRCASETPHLDDIAPGYTVSCHFPWLGSCKGSSI